MSIKNTPNMSGLPAEPSRRKKNVSRAMLVSLCFGVLLAGIVFLSYKMLKVRDAATAASEVVWEPAIPSAREAARPPAPASSKARFGFSTPGAPKGKGEQRCRHGLGSATCGPDHRSGKGSRKSTTVENSRSGRRVF